MKDFKLVPHIRFYIKNEEKCEPLFENTRVEAFSNHIVHSSIACELNVVIIMMMIIHRASISIHYGLKNTMCLTNKTGTNKS